HAPQALMRWGVKAIVGESFADIFFGNCVAMGLPCVTASEQDLTALTAAVDEDPAHDLKVDLEKRTAEYRGRSYAIQMPEGSRKQLLDGTWDATRVLLAAAEQVRGTAKKLPYVRG